MSRKRTSSELRVRSWEHRFKELVAFKRKFGHCRVPTKYAANRPLANWVAQQRSKKKRGLLDPEESRRLSALGFCWELHRRRLRRRDWDAMVAALAAFKKRYGHCDVPPQWTPNPDLAAWVRNVRSAKRGGTLDPRRIRQLTKLGIVWDPMEQRWRESYAALVQYKKKHGDCNVPAHRPENKPLAYRVQVWRRLRKVGSLPAEWVKRLDKIGFVWDWREHAWETRYAELIEFRREHGHCRVSAMSTTHPELGHWVNAQRSMQRLGTLSRERIRRLNRIGFQWRTKSRPIAVGVDRRTGR